ncbi:MAG: hydroxymethylbilane synthase, partial [Acidobacteriota bacterium]
MNRSSTPSRLAVQSIRVGTRGSALAQWQTHHIISALNLLQPDLQVEIRIIKTEGDREQIRPLAELGGLGVFTKAIEDALLADEIDLAVHSLKDLPTEIANGLTIAAIPERQDPRDCLVSRHKVGLFQLPPGALIGTSSARRAAQIIALRPDVHLIPLRGNVDTRLRKAQSEEYDA